jgi:hypothetical protein
VGKEKFAASIAPESALTTQHEYECHENPTEQQRGGGIVFCPRNLMPSAQLAAIWTFDRHGGDARVISAGR